MNTWHAMGNLTRDVEIKNLPSGSTVAQFGIAVNRKWRNRDGELQEEVTFVDCEAWGRTAETIAKWFSKGKPVLLEARLKLDQWQDQQGNKRSKIKAVVEKFHFVGGKSEGGSGGNGGGSSQSQPQDSRPPVIADDDIPF